jgi:spore coat protein U-like protein
MKKLIFSLLVAMAMVQPAAAQTASGQFDVNITLTSACTLSAITAVDFTYTSFQPGVQNSGAASGGFSVSCTNTLPYTFGLQAGSGAATPPGAATIGPINDDAVNLQYSLALSAAGGTGNGAAQAYRVTGTMAAGQGGTCAAASCTNAAATNNTHTLIVNY